MPCLCQFHIYHRYSSFIIDILSIFVTFRLCLRLTGELRSYTHCSFLVTLHISNTSAVAFPQISHWWNETTHWFLLVTLYCKHLSSSFPLIPHCRTETQHIFTHKCRSHPLINNWLSSLVITLQWKISLHALDELFLRMNRYFCRCFPVFYVIF